MNFRFVKYVNNPQVKGFVAHNFDIPQDKILLVTREGARIVSKGNVLVKSFRSAETRHRVNGHIREDR